MDNGWSKRGLLPFLTKPRHWVAPFCQLMASEDDRDTRKLRKALDRQASAASCKRQRSSVGASRSDDPEHTTTLGTEDSASELPSAQSSLGLQRRCGVKLLKAHPKTRPVLRTRLTTTTSTSWQADEHTEDPQAKSWQAEDDMEEPQPKKRPKAMRIRRQRKTSAPGTIKEEEASASSAPLASSAKKESLHPAGHEMIKAKQEKERWRSLSKSTTAQRKIVPWAAGPKRRKSSTSGPRGRGILGGLSIPHEL